MCYSLALIVDGRAVIFVLGKELIARDVAVRAPSLIEQNSDQGVFAVAGKLQHS